MNSQLPAKQKAVVLHPAPTRNIRLEVVDVPKIEGPDDAIVRITLAGLCGSDLHAYRGLEPFNNPYVMGHELVGHVVALGTSFAPDAPEGRPELYRTLRLGDKVISPFTTSCMECEYCMDGFSSRCVYSRLFGSPLQPGAQAQYIRIPKAGGNLTRIRPDSEIGSIRDESLLLLADILPTGYHAANNGLKSRNIDHLRNRKPLLFAVVGLGPVGLCTVISALNILNSLPRHERPVSSSFLLVDTNASRRSNALRILKPTFYGLKGLCDVVEALDTQDATEWARERGGMHIACEVVGNNSALQLAYDLIRPFGVISSVGVHNAPQFPLSGDDLYNKNVSLTFGRCPARSLFDEACQVLLNHQELFGVGEGRLIERVISIGGEDGEQSVQEAYHHFDQGISGKVILDLWN
ncbi:hypothetical protein FRB94_005613 [Tulasnella sp. JGI-2019a]|nr:hypothetical protein FRB93_006323 [Tulasnella sp. JGI-2019a]KAG9000217.1 hypothetical protein FRB94_005613 [Tulasnella sp. JGI-2019a]